MVAHSLNKAKSRTRGPPSGGPLSFCDRQMLRASKRRFWREDLRISFGYAHSCSLRALGETVQVAGLVETAWTRAIAGTSSGAASRICITRTVGIRWLPDTLL